MHPTVAKIVRAAELLEQTPAWAGAMRRRGLPVSPASGNLPSPSSQTRQARDHPGAREERTLAIASEALSTAKEANRIASEDLVSRRSVQRRARAVQCALGHVCGNRRHCRCRHPGQRPDTRGHLRLLTSITGWDKRRTRRQRHRDAEAAPSLAEDTGFEPKPSLTADSVVRFLDSQVTTVRVRSGS
jgi:hypothetical protein